MIFCPDGIIPDSSLTGPNNTYVYIYIYIERERERKKEREREREKPNDNFLAIIKKIQMIQ